MTVWLPLTRPMPMHWRRRWPRETEAGGFDPVQPCLRGSTKLAPKDSAALPGSPAGA